MSRAAALVGVLAEALPPRQFSDERRRLVAVGARAERCRRSFAYFVQQAWHVLEPNTPLEWKWYHQVICDHVQGVLEDWRRRMRDPTFRQRARNMLFNLPPGTLKSRIISVMANAWMWIESPEWTVTCLSANPDVAERDAIFCRDLVTSDWYVSTFAITWTIREDIDAKKKFGNTRGGQRKSFGITSKITGSRTDALLIDDPNDAHEVYSAASRREVNNKWKDAIYNRVNDLRVSVRIGIQQRLHVDDWSGFWMKSGRKKGINHVVQISLAMEFNASRATRATMFGTVDPRNDNQESLDPDRFDAELIAAERERMGSFGFEAQYNQNPGDLEGEMFLRRRWRFFVMPGQAPNTNARPRGCDIAIPARVLAVGARGKLDLEEIIVTVDCSFGSVNDGASNVAITVIGTRQADKFVIEDRTAKRTFFGTLDAIDRVLVDFPDARKVLVENKANGAAVLEVFQSRVAGFIAVDPEGGKTVRAHAMSVAHESGNWYLLEGAPWLQDYVDEFAAFPFGRFDDRVDAASQLSIYVAANATVASRWAALARR